MRIAVLIIGLVLMIVEVLQSCALHVAESVAKAPNGPTAGASGLAVGFMYLLGVAFILSFPVVSIFMFAFAGAIAFSIPRDQFPDMQVWGWISAALAVLSLFGAVGRQRERKRAAKSVIEPPTPARQGPSPVTQIADSSYDRRKWEALLKYDNDIARVAEKLSVLGDRWVEEFAKSYLAINDKAYLPTIVNRILSDAREEREP